MRCRLVAGDARVIDRVAFEVRGAARAAAPTP
jgi:hypothetical protein